jgi:hypothetical protein
VLTASNLDTAKGYFKAIDRGGLVIPSSKLSELVARSEALIKELKRDNFANDWSIAFFKGSNQLYVLKELCLLIVEPRVGGDVRFQAFFDDCSECHCSRRDVLLVGLNAIGNILLNNLSKKFRNELFENSKQKDAKSSSALNDENSVVKDRSFDARKLSTYEGMPASSHGPTLDKVQIAQL